MFKALEQIKGHCKDGNGECVHKCTVSIDSGSKLHALCHRSQEAWLPQMVRHDLLRSVREAEGTSKEDRYKDGEEGAHCELKGKVTHLGSTCTLRAKELNTRIDHSHSFPWYYDQIWEVQIKLPDNTNGRKVSDDEEDYCDGLVLDTIHGHNAHRFKKPCVGKEQQWWPDNAREDREQDRCHLYAGTPMALPSKFVVFPFTPATCEAYLLLCAFAGIATRAIIFLHALINEDRAVSL
mmetsp:Transcript_19209/g.35921  ORF Transcript_19209/g.35921 Transcript_19209/m.35921 type:complete len:237 (-) Transcript_19209:531-1241(-)